MSGWLFWIGVIAALIIAAALIEAYVKRNRKRKLADMRPDPDKLSKVGGIERYGLDPVTLAQAEHRRLEKEGWALDLPDDKKTSAQAVEKEKQDERR
ncbi:hypothetical protein SAMN05444358_101873 [Ruegeria halocynthiae]|uniref:Uncharacterized protein n=1 Tax=Ruegeria halocynthiae TaxID=985054 RepID=A0A1H2TP69_9RHOB|nr:hypothetical protein [Ruegeria halocynthiae]SDW45681.1 hypothetical protein SAMN05444358_101873 [Ruegeria halocynthiae]